MPGNKPTHFLGGVSNAAPSTPLYLFPYIDPATYHVWFDDFDSFDANKWIAQNTTTTNAKAIADADGGIVAFTAAAIDDNLQSYQWGGNNTADVAETFTFESTKKLFMVYRFKLSAASQTDMQVGLVIADTTPLDASDMIAFTVADGSATVSATIKSASGTTTQALGTLVDGTYSIVAIAYIPGEGFSCYYNNVLVATGIATTNAPTTELAISMTQQSGQASPASVMSSDYLLIAKER